MLATPKLDRRAQPALGAYLRGRRTAARWALQACFWLGFVWIGCALEGALPEAGGSPQERLRDRTSAEYAEARRAYHKTPEQTEVAVRFGRACFEWAELQEEGRARIATEGIGACRAALVTEPGSAAGFYFLALNQGQLARTKKLGALKLVDEMESAFLKAIEGDPAMEYAGPHRSLGLLYQQAPGWPLSVGDGSKARQHLEKAVKLVPEYPGNHLALLEAYIESGKKELARGRLDSAEREIGKARGRLTGERWEVDWLEWDDRWKAVQAALKR